MATINNRICQVVELSGLSKTWFARTINVSQSMISKLCSGKATPSDRTISDICRVYSINEEWLRTGKGEMHDFSRRDSAIEGIISVMFDKPLEAKKLLRQTLERLPDYELDIFDIAFDAVMTEKEQQLKPSLFDRIIKKPPQD